LAACNSPVASPANEQHHHQDHDTHHDDGEGQEQEQEERRGPLGFGMATRDARVTGIGENRCCQHERSAPTIAVKTGKPRGRRSIGGESKPHLARSCEPPVSATGYGVALALTQIVEAPVYGWVLTVFAGVRLRHALAASIIVNLISHPLFSAVLVPLADRVVSPLDAVLIGEVIVCAIEAGLLYAWLRREPLVMIGVSLVANGCSFAAGLIFFAFVPTLR
jgi:hypothetical protein